jgi:magnesium transporter
MAPRGAAAVLLHLDEERRDAALLSLPEEQARGLRTLVAYPPETAGGIMDPQVVSLAVDLRVREAVDLMRRAPRQSLYYLYVTDRDGVLHGVLSLRDLLLSGAEQPIRPLVNPKVESVPVGMDREEVAALMRERRFVCLPVVDDEQHLLGVVKHDEVLDTVGEEAFEDMQKMVGAGGDESALSPVSTVVRRRLPWLYVNLVTAFLASAVVGLFESTIAQVTALAVFLPIVSGQGGNSGAQALAVVMRGISLREIVPGSVWKVIWKEFFAGLLNGFTVAMVTGLAVGLWSRSAAMGLVIGLAMTVNMGLAALAGTMIPLALKRLGRDPAQSSIIFLTTVTDIVGFASFLGFAALFMRYLK